MKNLILDIDHTIIHYHENRIYIRPELDIFLKEVVKYYNVHLYTAGEKNYCEFIANYLEWLVEQKIFTNKFCNLDCESRVLTPELNISVKNHKITWKIYETDNETNLFKDFNKLGFNDSDTIVLDDNPFIYEKKINNVIHIKPWYYYDNNDTLLSDVLQTLKTIAQESDIKQHIQTYNRNTYIKVFKPILKTLKSKYQM